jgi:hypothetical protein
MRGCFFEKIPKKFGWSKKQPNVKNTVGQTTVKKYGWPTQLPTVPTSK